MISKFKLFKTFSCLDYRIVANLYKGDIHVVNAMQNLSWNNFCSMTQSTHVDDAEFPTESAELPGWVKFSESDNTSVADSDDDFVIPSIARWVENKKIDSQPKVLRTRLSENIDSDAERIIKILKTRYSSPDEAAKAIIDCSNVNVSEGLVEQLLNRFSNDWINASGVFKWAKEQTGYRHTAEVYNLMVDILGKGKRFNLMWEVVEEMHQFDGYVTLITMSKVMRRFSKVRMQIDAIEAFRRMEQFGVNMDVSAMNVLMDTLAKENSVEDAEEVLLEFKSRIPPNSHTFNILIQGWCKARKIDIARKRLEDMEKHGFPPDAISYTSFIKAYCRDRDFRNVDAILDEMREKGCPPSVVTYTIIMHALGKAKELCEAFKIYERMKQDGCVPDSAFFSSLIFSLSKAGRLKDAQELFEDMTKQGVSPDILTYNTMIYFACHHSEEEKALILLLEMKEASCKPDLKTYAPLLKMCCRNKRMKVLSFLLNHMFRNGISFEFGTYFLLVHELCKSGKLEHACLFFEEMVLKGFTPQDSTYKILMEKLEGKNMGKAKELIGKLMLQATTLLKI